MPETIAESSVKGSELERQYLEDIEGRFRQLGPKGKEGFRAGCAEQKLECIIRALSTPGRDPTIPKEALQELRVQIRVNRAMWGEPYSNGWVSYSKLLLGLGGEQDPTLVKGNWLGFHSSAIERMNKVEGIT